MNGLVDVLTAVTVVGSGVVTGILLIFSNTVMPSLARHPGGAATMVTINERILNPIFILFFAGTTVACAALFVLTLLGYGVGGQLTLLGSGLYLVGVFGVTAAVNVPMNDALAALTGDSTEAAEYWAEYLRRWTRWNTVRTVLGLAGTALLATALLAASLEGQASFTDEALAPSDERVEVGMAARSGPPDKASIAAAARAIIDAYTELGWFSGSALVAHEGVPILELSVGMANREAGTPNGRETRYNLGSIMKHYTAVLILQQVEAGSIGLDDVLEEFDLGFPPETAARVTVRHLLHHRSGFPDVLPAEYREDPLAFESIAQKLRLLQDSPLLFEPGSDDRYSNYGYIVLGAILEKVTGRPFADLLRERIFDPLGLYDSVYPYRADRANQSLRYTFNHAGEQVFVGVTEHHGPDGGIEATTADVLSFYRTLFYGDALLSPERGVRDEYFAPRDDLWSAFGGGVGVSSAVELDLANHYEIVVLANTDQLVAEEISGRIHSYIQTGSYDPVMLPPQIYAWQAYRAMGQDAFAAGFRERYESAGYTRFVGRTVNELGMSLLDAESWEDAFAVFGVLAAWFPDAPQVYDSLAYALWRRGEVEQAQEMFGKSLALQPGFSSEYSADDYGIEGS